MKIPTCAYMLFILVQNALDDTPVNEPQESIYKINTSGGAFSPWFDNFSSLMLVIGGIVALIAAIKIYNNWQIGNPNVYESVGNWMWGSLALIITGIFLKGFFSM